MRDFGSTVLIATPSYALYMAEVAERMDALKDIRLRVGLFGAEASTEEMRAELERRYGILATENYGLTEVMGPGVSGECEYKCGMHINEDCFLAEIIDPDTGEVLPMGEQGELVLTTLAKEAQPALRYRTRDITRLIEEPCACGRTQLRMEKIKGRSDDMLIIRGVNVFPSQIESVLVGQPGIGPHYEIVVTASISPTICRSRWSWWMPRCLKIQRAGKGARPHSRAAENRAAIGCRGDAGVAQHPETV